MIPWVAVCQGMGVYCTVIQEKEGVKRQKSDGCNSLFAGWICTSLVAGPSDDWIELDWQRSQVKNQEGLNGGTLLTLR